MKEDIFDDIRKPSFKVPEGYFENLKERLNTIPEKSEAPAPATFWQKFRPYLVMAASFAASLVIGTAILKTTAGPKISETDQFYSELGYADLIPVTLADPAIYEDTPSEEVSNEEIADYLIATGVSAEKIRYAMTSDY